MIISLTGKYYNLHCETIYLTSLCQGPNQIATLSGEKILSIRFNGLIHCHSHASMESLGPVEMLLADVLSWQRGREHLSPYYIILTLKRWLYRVSPFKEVLFSSRSFALETLHTINNGRYQNLCVSWGFGIKLYFTQIGLCLIKHKQVKETNI